MYKYKNVHKHSNLDFYFKISSEFSTLNFTASFCQLADPETQIKKHKILTLKILVVVFFQNYKSPIYLSDIIVNTSPADYSFQNTPSTFQSPTQFSITHIRHHKLPNSLQTPTSHHLQRPPSPNPPLRPRFYPAPLNSGPLRDIG